jgi:ABC-2 type transport system ATP-binding protein
MPGRYFGLLGSNGAGKSTTIKMLTTLLPPSSGEARVGGFSITTQPVEVRRAIGYVPQAVSVDGSLTGYENLLIFAKLYDIPRSEQQARIREQLTFVDLSADAGRLGKPVFRRHGPPARDCPGHVASATCAVSR